MVAAMWLAIAREELRAAELLAQHGMPRLSCFHAHQAAEKALTALRLHQEDCRSTGRNDARDRSDQADAFPAPTEGDLPGTRSAALLPSPGPPLRSGALAGPETDAAGDDLVAARALIQRVTDQVYGEEVRGQ